MLPRWSPCLITVGKMQKEGNDLQVVQQERVKCYSWEAVIFSFLVYTSSKQFHKSRAPFPPCCMCPLLLNSPASVWELRGPSAAERFFVFVFVFFSSFLLLNSSGPPLSYFSFNHVPDVSVGGRFRLQAFSDMLLKWVQKYCLSRWRKQGLPWKRE